MKQSNRGTTCRATPNAPGLIWALVTGLLVVSAVAPTVLAAGTGPHAWSTIAVRPRAVGNSWLNYNTTDRSDINLVAVSPDGSYVAAASSDRQVHLFQANGAAPLVPVATRTLPDNTNATTLAISDASATGTPLLLIGYGSGPTVPSALEAWNISGGGMFSGAPAWKLVTTSLDLPPRTTGWIREAAISQDGNVVLVMTSFNQGGNPGMNLSYFETGSTLFHYKFGQNFSSYWPVNIALDADGGRGIAAVNIAGGTPAMVVVESSGFDPTNWIMGGSAGQLLQGTISGSGQLMYGVTTSGLYIGNALTRTTNSSVGTSVISSVDRLSASYSGLQLLAGGGQTAYYFNWSAGSTWSSPVWKASYSGAVQNVSLAPQRPNYFVISSQNSVSFFYYYAGMPQSANAAYRTGSTLGPLLDLALSQMGGTLGVGSGYIASGGEEFTLVTDGGIPLPQGGSVSAQAVTPAPGDGSAKLQVSWTTPTNVPITQMVLVVTTSPAGAPGNFPSPIYPALGTSSYTVTGLSFATNYSIEMTFQAFDGASSATTTPVIVATAAAPAVQDPFLALEIAAVVLLVGGLLAYFLVGRRGGAPRHPSPEGSDPNANLPPAPHPGAPGAR